MKKKSSNKPTSEPASKKIPCVIRMRMPNGHFDVFELQDRRHVLSFLKLIESDAAHRVDGATIEVVEGDKKIECRVCVSGVWTDQPVTANAITNAVKP